MDTHGALTQWQVKRVTSKQFFQAGHRRDGLWHGGKRRKEGRGVSVKCDLIEGETRTPPSRMRRGSTPHSSLMADSSALNQGSSRSPSHQSAV